jgi:hypothetical protein
VTEPLEIDIVQLARSNDAFRREIATGEHSQIVAMTIPPGGEIGEEVHEENDQLLVFVDGVERANVSFSSDPTWNSSRDLRIGRPVSSTSLAQRYLQGSIDEPALYTTALSAATVLAHYEAGKP